MSRVDKMRADIIKKVREREVLAWGEQQKKAHSEVKSLGFHRLKYDQIFIGAQAIHGDKYIHLNGRGRTESIGPYIKYLSQDSNGSGRRYRECVEIYLKEEGKNDPKNEILDKIVRSIMDLHSPETSLFGKGPTVRDPWDLMVKEVFQYAQLKGYKMRSEDQAIYGKIYDQINNHYGITTPNRMSTLPVPTSPASASVRKAAGTVPMKRPTRNPPEPLSSAHKAGVSATTSSLEKIRRQWPEDRKVAIEAAVSQDSFGSLSNEQMIAIFPGAEYIMRSLMPMDPNTGINASHLRGFLRDDQYAMEVYKWAIEAFFTEYGCYGADGSLGKPQELPRVFSKIVQSLIELTESNSELLFSSQEQHDIFIKVLTFANNIGYRPEYEFYNAQLKTIGDRVRVPFASGATYDDRGQLEKTPVVALGKSTRTPPKPRAAVVNTPPPVATPLPVAVVTSPPRAAVVSHRDLKYVEVKGPKGSILSKTQKGDIWKSYMGETRIHAQQMPMHFKDLTIKGPLGFAPPKGSRFENCVLDLDFSDLSGEPSQIFALLKSFTFTGCKTPLGLPLTPEDIIYPAGVRKIGGNQIKKSPPPVAPRKGRITPNPAPAALSATPLSVAVVVVKAP
jgi:hypothetical protein